MPMSRLKYLQTRASEAEQFANEMEFFAGGPEGGFLPKKEPSGNSPA
jgi:hypothetical protein